MSVVKKEFQFGNQKVIIETGRIARQATGAVMVHMGDTVVLVSCVAKKNAREGQDFFPLTVDYQEKTYAAGKIPGGFFKREGRPSEKETLTCRLIDRPIRPLFPKEFKNEIQIIANVISLDPCVDPDIPAIIGASASLSLTGVPFNGPIGAARVGYKEGQYILNPSFKELDESELDLVVAGTNSSVLMVESEAKQLSEDIMLGAVMFGHQELQIVIDNIKALVEETGTKSWEWVAAEKDEILESETKKHTTDLLREAYTIHNKLERKERLSEIKNEVVEIMTNEEEPQWSSSEIIESIEKLESHIVRSSILSGENRIDGRDSQTIRPITVETGILPRTHGSA